MKISATYLTMILCGTVLILPTISKAETPLLTQDQQASLDAAKKEMADLNASIERAKEAKALEESANTRLKTCGYQLKDLPSSITADVPVQLAKIIAEYSTKTGTWRPFVHNTHGPARRGPTQTYTTTRELLVDVNQPIDICTPVYIQQPEMGTGYILRYQVAWKLFVLPNRIYEVDLHYSGDGKFLQAILDEGLTNWIGPSEQKGVFHSPAAQPIPQEDKKGCVDVPVNSHGNTIRQCR